MRWCIETNSGQVLEVTKLFNARGEDTEELDLAEAILIHFTDGSYGAHAVVAQVHPVQ